MRETGKLIKLLSEASNWILDAAETKAEECERSIEASDVQGCRKCGGADIGLAVETTTVSLWKPYEMGDKVVCRG